jgi:hypothetical protein
LHDDPANARIGIQGLNRAADFCLRDLRWQLTMLKSDAHSPSYTLLIANAQ